MPSQLCGPSRIGILSDSSQWVLANRVIVSAIDSGLNSMPGGEAVTRDLARCNFDAIFSAKHEPSEKIDFEWSICSEQGLIFI